MRMQEYSSRQQHRQTLREGGRLPDGFQIAVSSLQFVPEERPSTNPFTMNLSLILADEPCTSFGLSLTKNRIPGAPITRARAVLNAESLQGILINNRVANVCTETGVEDAGDILAHLGAELGLDSSVLLSSSTGIIGWRLPVEPMKAALPGLVAQLGHDSMLAVAESIMTTDSFPKLRRIELGGGSIVGVAKGAGMIEPNMATMLAFILTDFDVPREVLREELAAAVSASFNRISVDGDQSTSDMVVALASGRRQRPDPREFGEALRLICRQLAEDVVRNGEGTRHVLRTTVSGAESELQAVAVAKAVVNSPLVKTALYGNDPNVGRIIAAVGDYCGNHDIAIDSHNVKLSIGEESVFFAGSFHLDKAKELRLSHYLQSTELLPDNTAGLEYPPHEMCVEVVIDLGLGSAAATVYGSDLSDEYVRINADYRT
ncbi:MAG: bifunctional glutamate N-acetyltransferase/amino-acid acetyltransferase ArgJ [Spirochaetaceae bacterium]|nr:MAG: bifunctional glutamate N-acetyltransferase/amino-acid acetyltransferase ArgJ [Spirochaetaceae bacterium]